MAWCLSARRDVDGQHIQDGDHMELMPLLSILSKRSL